MSKIQKQPSSNFSGRKIHLIVLALGLLRMAAAPDLTAAADTSRSDNALADLTLEELLDIEVTSASRRPQKSFRTAAAISVITQEDIRRSGATSIPEALRMVPGLQVARIDSNKWAITARGFNNRFANKLLVLIDGRSVYSPLLSGVFWDVQDLLLEDIERIEVIRGPGATLWGANAVNGVISIVTKHSGSTTGGFATARGASHEGFTLGGRYGAQLGDGATFRVYGKHFDREDFVDNVDDWRVTRGGFRLDWQAGMQDELTFQGDIYQGQVGERITVPRLVAPFFSAPTHDLDIAGANLMTKWTRNLAPDSDLQLQVYFDRTEREVALSVENRNTFDVDFQHRFSSFGSQETIWGLGYRWTEDDTHPLGALAALRPSRRADQVFSAFLQQDISSRSEKWTLTFGSKVEHNDYTGFEAQPSIRFIWTPDEGQSLWTSVSRAVRIPTRSEVDAEVNLLTLPPNTVQNPGPLPVLLRLVGNDEQAAEEVVTYELGYRFRTANGFLFEISGFFNDFDNLASFEPADPFTEFAPSPLHVVSPLVLDNKNSGYTHGVEVSAQWRQSDLLSLQGNYSYLNLELRGDSGSRDISTISTLEGSAPAHQFYLRSSWNLRPDLELDLSGRWVDRLPSLEVPSYFSLDAGLAWKFSESGEISVVGQDLSDKEHLEFVSDLFSTPVARIDRRGYAQITWRF